MLKLTNIKKEYVTGNEKVHALKGVSIEFRNSEFVSVLGPSGCGKTTLLNIIGGLDRYTDGDLTISGKSTKSFDDKDWDNYRNHSIGFVFQSYNLIPHQSVLSNVELALTLSGVSRTERRQRAKEALESVGLGDQLSKKPNQMSGGQMQRVAIARALVNNPDILLADEPTGALDSTTSVQIMELLSEIAKDRLVIMVTHNPELAEKYSTRIIRLFDGEVKSDSDPYTAPPEDTKNRKRTKKPSMSLLTALSLSLNNLMTKKTRTVLISFAGSIGIIGIALILSVSNGVQNYINRVQEDTLSSYPLSIRAEQLDMSSLVSALMNTNGGADDENPAQESTAPQREPNRVYASSVLYKLMNTANSMETKKNNLEKFKKYISESEEFAKFVTSVQYGYKTKFDIYTTDSSGKIVNTDVKSLMEKIYGAMGISMGTSGMMDYYTGYDVFDEMIGGIDGEPVNDLLKKQYDVIGRWPENYDEAVLVLNRRDEISDITLYALGLQTSEEISSRMKDAMDKKQVDTTDLGSWDYDELMARDLRIILPVDCYQEQNGKYVDLSATDAGVSFLYNSASAIKLKIVGIVKLSENATGNGMLQGGTIVYTNGLTNHIIEKTLNSEILKKQLADSSVDVISGKKFPSDTDVEPADSEKAALVREYIGSLTSGQKAELYKAIKSAPTEEYLNGVAQSYLAGKTRDELIEEMTAAYASQMGIDDTTEIKSYIASLSDDELNAYFVESIKKVTAEQYAKQVEAQLANIPESQLCAAFDSEQAAYDEKTWADIYDRYMPSDKSESTYEEALEALGYVTFESPASINIYTDTFANKDEITKIIEKYNSSLSEDEEDDKISYTDYVAQIMSSVSTIIDAIAYVLIAFVAISLVVSSIMIGIITYISVLERTKEIGILRSIGASKRDISRVFNAETLIVGFTAGVFGILITLLLLIPINIILHSLTDIASLSAALPALASVGLVLISMFLTFIAGLIPAAIAAKKDPVEALRTE